jgi:hypothetical protein
MNSTIHAAAAQQCAVGGIHDRIDGKRGDIGDNDVEDCVSDFGS